MKILIRTLSGCSKSVNLVFNPVVPNLLKMIPNPVVPKLVNLFLNPVVPKTDS